MSKRCQEIMQIKIRHTKTTDFTLFSTIKSIENTTKTLLKYREGGRTVGSGKVSKIVE